MVSSECRVNETTQTASLRYCRYFIISVCSVSSFSFHLEKLELAPGRSVYAGANLCGFMAARAEMGAALGGITD
jgi:hypothetical protein